MKTNKSRNEEKKRVPRFMGMLLCLVLAGGFVLHAAIPTIEREALIALYNATDGDNWTVNSGWKDGALEPDGFGPVGSEGNWFGIDVSDDHVLMIDLSGYNLTGNIPSELGNLSHLVFIFLGGNKLNGSIPPELSNLDNLTHLSLWDNQLSGSIPSQLGDFSSLKELEVGRNQLSGSIPPELGKLSHLRFLNLSENQLSGSIPPELGDLGNLMMLYLFDNKLTGGIPLELVNLSKLEELHLSENQLSGNIPPELGNLSNLTGLGLADNNLEGSIPSELGNFSDRGSLFLSRNRLSGSIPSSLMNLTHWSPLTIAYNGLYTDNEELRTFLNTKNPDWEKSQTIAPGNITAAGTSNISIKVSWTPIVYTTDTGNYRIFYSTTSGGPWLYYGETSSKDDSFLDVTALYSGTKYYFKIQTQTDPHSKNENTVLSEPSEVVAGVTGSPLAEKAPPFGSFDTPIDNLTAYGSIPVTGWALDDSGIDTVKIYRELGNQLVYIGDGGFIEGARPDVAAAYSTYPGNTKAGWGYMLLTNFLPNTGNGTFVLHAIATDVNGKTTTLGTKTIQCDNDNAVKPFGAIDTPTQGGGASGTDFVNFGWALTPQPNTIPIDGSNITVWVDGVALGNPVYNKYRSDIAALFPNYNNSNGAVGYFYLDTTGYTNSVHTIQWTVKD
ncbi:MAG: hypothetical protein GY940_35445, partial [bacterium]|nr:hypothetical protein [bacterium]